MKKFLVFCSLVVMLVGLTAFNASAAQMNGGVSFSGDFDVNTGNVLTANSFTSFSNVVVQSGSGTWAAVGMNTPATFTPFTFNPGSNVIPLWSFTSGGTTYSFNALGSAMTFDRETGAIPALDITGTGTVVASLGFDPTPGAYKITANQSSTTFSFSSSSATTAVPEPVTLLLVGFGLVGVAGLSRKFKK